MKKPATFGKYFLLERISVGGMAEVFRAKAFGVEGFERLVAVKRILASVAEDKEFIRLFIEEAKLSVQLTHANIAQIFDLGVVDGSYYIALEHVHGRDLRGILERCRQLGEAMPVAQACFIAMKVCEGLDYAHNKRDQSGRELALVHRDVSPQNILVSFEGEVKLIDFGVAKAAGTSSKTQAGVLKGKFGYMSPEQVRGLPIDRRSDVFSCGIVLYELLTGERLFAGDSELSTQDKIRNAEILPPSTYNRKIPDELERIVLKALDKDVGERYRSAIDLHDELHVYTAGEFYSRKDLAGWMKKAFGKEIDEETAKLESYRQLKPPAPFEPHNPPSQPVAPAKPPQPEHVSFMSLPLGSEPAAAPVLNATPAIAVMPPAPVAASSVAPPAAAAPPAGAAPRSAASAPSETAMSLATADQAAAAPRPAASRPSVTSTLIGAAPAGAVAARSTGSSASDASRATATSLAGGAPAADAVAATPGHALPRQPEMRVVGQLDPSAIGWEDDEVETQIYVDQDKNTKHKVSRRPSMPLPPPAASSPAISLVEIDPVAVAEIPSVSVLVAGARGEFPAVSTDVVSETTPSPRFDLHDDTDPVAGREISAPSRLVSAVAPNTERRFVPMTAFGARITSRRRLIDHRRTLVLAIGGAAAAVIAMIVVVVASGEPEPSAAPRTDAKPVVSDAATGFDLYVTPSGLTKWRLDGESRTDRLPSRIRGISAGVHTVQIEAPPGFLSQRQPVTVEQGKASRIDIKLQAMAGIVGTFDSVPGGATVSLIVDGKHQTLGASPATAPLDPRSTYQVQFEKPGYVSATRSIRFSGELDERVTVNLEKAGADAPAGADPKPASKPAAVPERKPPVPAAGSATAKPTDASGHGVLALDSTPPCEIVIDGASTGLRTPQLELKLAAGSHQVTLINRELAIRETIAVEVAAGATETVIKDFSERISR